MSKFIELTITSIVDCCRCTLKGLFNTESIFAITDYGTFRSVTTSSKYTISVVESLECITALINGTSHE